MDTEVGGNIIKYFSFNYRLDNVKQYKKMFLISLLHPFLFLASVVIGFVAVVVAAAGGVANANYIKCC